MLYARLIKISQTVRETKKGPIKVQELKVEEPGTLKLNDGTLVQIYHSDKGRILHLETNLIDRTKQIFHFR